MREVLFRGKNDHKGVWLEGYVGEVFDDKVIVTNLTKKVVYPVNPKSIGQYTGLTDKNSKKIFEGDIIAAKYPDQTRSVPGIVKYGEFKDVDSCDTYHYLGFYIEIWGHCISILEPMNDGIELEVIGNIHDNPELLEV